MFTGIIEEIGVVSLLARKDQSGCVTISLKKMFNDLARGDSISVNGVCLTVTEVGRNAFAADISPETIETSNLSQLKIGQKVNLERALSFGGRLGGHLVLGHVDGIVLLVEKRVTQKGYEFFFNVPRNFKKYIVAKGSVALDGVSLTVASITKDGFSVAMIPHSIQATNFNQKHVGDKINLEVDIISKYIENLLRGDPVTPTEAMFMESGILPIGIVDN
ncbi:riboflavin synthase subunit alpha [candidate division WOR-1 bacterium RIFOXYC2_FULL_37_10]|uniref:Riboflavin synthase n=1 Tax=candidate division WOR-1 bacterium RIFOXYB2_FULL_37_13 TaxID=1802579 RepID=A0A1F4SWY0_UNCSA|nr:MAG: riboflavin synthase subunit alpha [candidate division WOR-1 bacterium RIFOXYA2_FULL_37_7]OGC24173.1 MAG: riboflavin synthase subunit alpha [candidate division WOR-1 bacterium RIFOXYB2_FULL_37_13]OGC37413.1 MAG: riboflavin synthase subunit alpha [candidate division WOR-1 bacterium RIFOXYC2_FULL_37_10]